MSDKFVVVQISIGFPTERLGEFSDEEAAVASAKIDQLAAYAAELGFFPIRQRPNGSWERARK